MNDYRLDTFLSLCDTRSYRKTAELLNITQPAVTQHIQYLERQYGCRLFTYENRRLSLTRSGITLEQYAHTLRVNEEALIRTLHNGDITSLRVGTTKTIGECVVSPYAQRFLKDPARELSLVVDNTRHLLDLIDHGRLDFALIEGNFDKTRYGYTLMSREPFVGICARNHPFAGRDIPLAQLLQETLICREEGSGTRAILENELQHYNESISHFPRKICISAFSMILDYVKKGMGISFVFQVLAQQNDLAVFHLENTPIHREFNIVYPRNTDCQEKIRCFLSPD